MAEQRSNDTWLLEKYITPMSLPNDAIVCWIKYETSLKFDSICIRFEADVTIKDFSNILYVLHNDDGKITFSRNQLTMDGFISFTGVYTKLPNEERKITFIVDFIHENKTIHSVSLTTNIIRPILIKKYINRTSIDISYITPPVIEPLDFQIVNIGSADPVSYIPVISSTSSDIKLKIESNDKVELIGEIFKERVRTRHSKLIVSGNGQTLITFNVEYRDTIGNVYLTKLDQLFISAEQNGITEIPLSGETIENRPKLIISSIKR